MKKKQKLDQERIGKALYRLIDRLGKTDDEKGYICYILFSVTGSILLKMNLHKFDEYVDEIKKHYRNESH